MERFLFHSPATYSLTSCSVNSQSVGALHWYSALSEPRKLLPCKIGFDLAGDVKVTRSLRWEFCLQLLTKKEIFFLEVFTFNGTATVYRIFAKTNFSIATFFFFISVSNPMQYSQFTFSFSGDHILFVIAVKHLSSGQRAVKYCQICFTEPF